MKKLKYIAFLFIVGFSSNNILANSQVGTKTQKQNNQDMLIDKDINTKNWMLEFNLTSEISEDQSSQKCCSSVQDSTKRTNITHKQDSIKIEDWMLNGNNFYVGFKYSSKEPEWLITHDFFIL